MLSAFQILLTVLMADANKKQEISRKSLRLVKDLETIVLRTFLEFKINYHLLINESNKIISFILRLKYIYFQLKY